MSLPSGRRLAIDFGQVRSGIAISDALGMIATPLETIDTPKLLARIGELAREFDLQTIYLGLPAHLSGSEGESARLVRHFADQLVEQKIAPIFLVDERLSSKSAEQSKEMVERFGIDAVAAAHILEFALTGERNTGKRFGEAVNA